jgi:hypothetical protein
MQFLGLASVAGVLAIAGVSAASTLRGRNTSETTSEGNVISDARPTTTTNKPVAPKAAPVVQQSAAVTTPSPETTKTPDPAPAPAPTVNHPISRAGFVLVEGRTQLTDSIYATRTGDSVVVNFDAYGFRTRRPDKIEQSLRLTMPMIFGKMATASIDTTGTLVTNRDVVGELARDGMRVKLDNGATAHIRVLTRVVSDGPIAIGYLMTIER